ncbi:MAG: hypothetical protein DYG89_13935 [Caldilinea sp. CFX5]|nr:hypothetical protein [Caldilinea sp. CFX5]
MVNPIASNISPAQATAIPWPQRFATALKTLWGIARPAATPTTMVETAAADKPVLLALQASLPAGRTDVVCLAVAGELTRHTYTSLIEVARRHYQQGQRYLLLDLRQTTQIELSGLFALLSIARLYSGQTLLDPEAGWAGLHTAVEEIAPALRQRVKLITPSPAAVAALERASFCGCFTHYPDVDTAIRAISR